MNEPFRTTRRVEFGDTDMAGIAHFANFFRYMEAAETDFLHALGLSVSWGSGSQRYGFPRVSVACDFKRSTISASVNLPSSLSRSLMRGRNTRSG